MRDGFGSWVDVMAAPTDEVVDAFHFFAFRHQFEETFSELNRPPAHP
jgi:hypothetical protein